jgi:hypothetical protein
MREGSAFVPLLIPLRAVPTARPILSFDCETFGRGNDFVLGVVSTPDGQTHRFLDRTKMYDYLSREEWEGHQIFATNLAFDSFAMFGDGKLPEGFSMFDNGSKIIWIKRQIREKKDSRTKTGKSKKSITWADSLNVFPAGVEEMGNILQKVARTYKKHYEKVNYLESKRLASYYDVKKLRSPGCRCDLKTNPEHDDCLTYLGKLRYEDMTPEQREETWDYCTNDALVTRLFMEWFQEQINELGATLKLTAASTAMDLFRRRFMREGQFVIPQPHWTCMVQSRLSYYGGRTEDFVKGTLGPVWDYDVASMYPSSMMEVDFPYPSPERFVVKENPPENCLQHEGFSFASVHVPRMHIPPLPYRYTDKLLFPCGDISGVWTNLELRYAREQGVKINDIAWSYFTEKTFNPFEGYVTELYGKRMEYAYPSDCTHQDCEYHRAKRLAAKCAEAMATEEVVKLFLNGLYGKFAQNFLTEEEQAELGVKGKAPGGTFKNIEDASEEEIMFTASQPEFTHYLARGYVLDRAIPKLKAFMNPILSSYVTARARVKLHCFFLMALAEKVGVLYCDTDSLYCDAPISFATQGKELGKLQVGKQWRQMTILGPKAKALLPMDEKAKPHFTTKGVPGKSFLYDDNGAFGELTTHRTKPKAELFDALTLNKSEVRYSRFLRFKEALARGRMPNEIVDATKKFNPLEFPKRRILGNPTLRDLTKRSFKTEPWTIRGQDIVERMEMIKV